MAIFRRFLVGLAVLLLAAQPAAASHFRVKAARTATAITYTLGTVAAGLQSVEDYARGGVGLRPGVPLTNTPASHVQACTSCTLDADGISFYIQGNNTLTNWDFGGFQVFLDGNVTVSCDNCRLASRSDRGATLQVAQIQTSTAPNWLCTHCYADPRLHPPAIDEGFVKWNGNGSQEWDDFYFEESSRDHIAKSGTGLLTLLRGYMGGVCIGTPGQNGGVHCENVHILNGTFSISRVLIDYKNSASRETAGVTGFLFFQAFTGSTGVSGTVDSSVFLHASTPSTVPNCHALDPACLDYSGLGSTFQAENGLFGTGVANLSVTISNNVLSRGSVSYITTTTDPGFTLTVTKSGNFNAEAGTALGSTLP